MRLLGVNKFWCEYFAYENMHNGEDFITPVTPFMAYIIMGIYRILMLIQLNQLYLT